MPVSPTFSKGTKQPKKNSLQKGVTKPRQRSLFTKAKRFTPKRLLKQPLLNSLCSHYQFKPSKSKAIRNTPSSNHTRLCFKLNKSIKTTPQLLSSMTSLTLANSTPSLPTSTPDLLSTFYFRSRITTLFQLPAKAQHALSIFSSCNKTLLKTLYQARNRQFSTYQRVDVFIPPQSPQKSNPSASVRTSPQAGIPVCSADDLNYINNVLYRPLGQIYQLGQPLFSTSEKHPRIQHYKCTNISTASHSDVSIYTFDNYGCSIDNSILYTNPSQNTTPSNISNTSALPNPIRFKLIEYLQPTLHKNTFSLSIPQCHYNDSQLMHTFDQSTIGYHRYSLLQTILSSLLNANICHQQQQLNTLTTSSITLPIDPNQPISFNFSSSIPKDYTNLLLTTIRSLLHFSQASSLLPHDGNTPLQTTAEFNILQWFQHEIFHFIPKSHHERDQQRMNRFYAQLYGNNEEINVRTTDGKIIDMNEGVDDPDLVNTVIKELGYNPHNLTSDQLTAVYSQVEKRLGEQDLKLQEVYSDFEGDSEEESSGTDDESFSQRHREELAQLKAITDKNFAKRHEKQGLHHENEFDINSSPDFTHKTPSYKTKKKHADAVGDVGDLLNPDEEILPQDQRLYHGILPPAAIKEMDRVEQLDAQYRQEYEALGLSRDEYVAQKKSERNQEQLNESQWIPSGNLYKHLKDQAVLYPKNKHIQIQLELLQSLSVDDVISHFEQIFEPLLYYNSQPSQSSQQHQDRKPSHKQISISVGGPDIHFPSIVKQVNSIFHTLPYIQPLHSDDTSIRSSPYKLQLDKQKFPLVHFNLPRDVPLSTVHSSLTFQSFPPSTLTLAAPSLTPYTSNSMTNPVTNWVNNSHLITNLSAPTRFLPQNIDTSLLETHFGFSTIHQHNQENVIDIGGISNDHLQDGTPIFRSRFHGLDRVAWLKHQLMNKQKSLTPNFEDKAESQTQGIQSLLLDSNAQYNLSLLLAASLPGNDPSSTTFPLHQQFQQLSPEGQIKVNTVLEQSALHIITRLIKQSIQNNKIIQQQANTTNPLNQFDLEIENTSTETFSFQPNLTFNIISHNTGETNNVISTVDNNITYFLQYLTTLVQPNLNFFAFQNIVQELFHFQRNISTVIASKQSSHNVPFNASSLTSTADIEDLILAKTFLPLLIFGTQQQYHPSAITPTTAALTSVHFETIFKRYFLSNPQRIINLSTEPTFYGHSISASTEGKVTSTSSLPKELTPREYSVHFDEISQRHVKNITDEDENAKQHYNYKLHRHFMKRLRFVKKGNNVPTNVEFNMGGILTSNDIVFDFETQPNHRRRRPNVTVRHLLGGSIALPINKHYNNNIATTTNVSGKITNVRKEYETKWIATVKSTNHPARRNVSTPDIDITGVPALNESISKQSQQIFDLLHEDGVLDCVVESNLDYKSSSIQSLSQNQHHSTNSTFHTILPHQSTNPQPQEHSLLMSHIKLQQNFPSTGQLYVPLTKQLSRPVHITITDMASQCLELDLSIDHVEKRLTPYQLLLLPFIEFLFAKQLPDNFSAHSAACNNSFQSKTISPSTLHNVLAQHDIDLQMKFVYFQSPTTAPLSYTATSQQQIKCIINGKCHIHQIELFTDIILHALTEVDLTQNIVDLLTNYSHSLTSIKHNDQFNDDGVDQQYKSIEGQQNSGTSEQHLFKNSPNLSLFHAMSRLTGLTADISAINNKSDSHIQDEINTHSTFLNLVHGTTSQQQLSTIISSLFTELNVCSQFDANLDHQGEPQTLISAKMGETYQEKVDSLPPLIKTLFFSSAAAHMRKAQHSLPSQQISPLLIIFVNDIAETLKCLLLGPAEQQFVHMKLPNKSNGIVTNHDHFNVCNNNYFTFNDHNIEPFDLKALQSHLTNLPLLQEEKEIIDHELFATLPSQASIPVPTHISTHTNLSTLSHKFDPTYPNIYQPSPIASPSLFQSSFSTLQEDTNIDNELQQPLYGISKLHIKTNKHTLTSPIYSSLLTSSLSKLVNNTYVSQITGYIPELSLVSCYLHQQAGNKVVAAEQVLSERVSQATNILHQGHHEAACVTNAAPQPQQINSTSVVPLLTVRNCYTLDPVLAEQQFNQQKQNQENMDLGKNVIRVSQHGLVNFVPQYHFGTVGQLTNELATTHISAENFIKGQSILTGIENTKTTTNYHNISCDSMRTAKLSSAGPQVHNRANHFIVAPVSSTSTTIAFVAPKVTPVTLQSFTTTNNLSEAHVGLTLLGQLLVNNLLTYGTNNSTFRPQFVPFDKTEVSESFLSYLHPFTAHTASSTFSTQLSHQINAPAPTQVKTMYNPIDGIFTLQHIKDNTSILSPSQVLRNSLTIASVDTSHLSKAVDHSECQNFVESLRVLITRLIDANYHNNDFSTPTHQINRFVCGQSTFEQLKVTLLTQLKANLETKTTSSTTISPTDITDSNLLISQITSTPSMIAAIKAATPAQVTQILKSILSFPKAKVSVVGPIDHVPEQVEADAKTTNGNWSLRVL